MSFDLHIFDIEDLDDEALGELMEDEAGCGHPPSDRLAPFMDELTTRYPGFDAPLTESVWTSWPFDTWAHGRGCTLNISWSSTEIGPEVTEMALRHGLSVYDPQEGRTFK